MAISGVISGNGGLSKVGTGSLFLSASNTYSGPTTNQSGMIELNATSTFGNGMGLLVLAGGDINARNTRSGAPIANPILLTGTSTISGDGTLTNSLRILPFSTSSLTTPSGALTIRHIGTNGYASNNIFRVRLTGGGFNFTRPITIGLIGDLPSTLSQLESYNDVAAGDQTFSGTISGTGQFRRDATNVTAAGRTILTGANSYSGGTIVNAGTLLVNNTLGSGTGSGFVAVSNNGTLGGSGIIAGSVSCAGVISPGQSAGVLTLGGGLDLSAGGTNLWQLAALETLGEGMSYDQIALTGGNLALGGTSKLHVEFIGSAPSPNSADPFWLTSHAWKIISLTNAATNSGSKRFPTILNGTFATGSFTNYADANGNVILAYNAVPASAPSIQFFSTIGPNEFAISFSTITNRTYILQASRNLSSPTWQNLSTNIAPANLLTLTNSTGGEPVRFYRIMIVP
jgi:autotransporter-associated beta strand protein